MYAYPYKMAKSPSIMTLTCEAFTRRKNACKNKASCIYNNRSLCSIHLQCVKSNEECPICFNYLEKKNRIKLEECGHYFHKDCLIMACNFNKCMDCPYCRTQISLRQSVDIFGTDNFATSIYIQSLQFPPNVRNTVFDTFDLINIIASLSKNDYVLEYINQLLSIIKTMLTENQDSQTQCVISVKIVSLVMGLTDIFSKDKSLQGLVLMQQQHSS